MGVDSPFVSRRHDRIPFYFILLQNRTVMLKMVTEFESQTGDECWKTFKANSAKIKKAIRGN